MTVVSDSDRSTVILTLVAVLTLLVSACSSPTIPSHAPSSQPATITGDQPAVIPYTTPLTVTGRYPTHCVVGYVGGKAHPDPTCTPGAVGNRVTQDTIATTICTTHWTDTIRPPLRITDPVKTRLMAAYGIPPSARATTELDHDIPLDLGGADDVTNLWPQPSDLPRAGLTNTKDAIERAIGKAVCDHRVTLAAARTAIMVDWTTALARLRL